MIVQEIYYITLRTFRRLRSSATLCLLRNLPERRNTTFHVESRGLLDGGAAPSMFAFTYEAPNEARSTRLLSS